MHCVHCPVGGLDGVLRGQAAACRADARIFVWGVYLLNLVFLPFLNIFFVSKYLSLFLFRNGGSLH